MRVLHAELLKVTTLRSALAAHALIALALVPVFVVELAPAGDASDYALLGVVLLELMVGLTAVVAAAGEFVSGAARSGFVAVPARWPVPVAKLVVHGGLTLASCGAALVVAWIATTLRDAAALRPLSDPAVGHAAAGTVLTLAGVSALGLALGFLTRSVAVGAGALFVLTVVPAFVVVAPSVTAWLPARLAQSLVGGSLPPEGHFAAPGPAAAAYLGWALVLMLAAVAGLRRRDL